MTKEKWIKWIPSELFFEKFYVDYVIDNLEHFEVFISCLKNRKKTVSIQANVLPGLYRRTSGKAFISGYLEYLNKNLVPTFLLNGLYLK